MTLHSLKHSYGFRTNRRGHEAVRKAKVYIEEGYRWVVDMDLEKFFDKVNHDRLMRTLAKKIKDKTYTKADPQIPSIRSLDNSVVRVTKKEHRKVVR